MKCKNCKEEKPPEDFYRDARRPLGRCSDCIVCQKKRALEWRHSHIERARANGRKWNREHPEKRAFNQREYRQRHKERMKEKNKVAYKNHIDKYKKDTADYRKKYPERERAHNILKSALRVGRVIKPTSCSKCGEPGYMHGHHADYSKPLQVEWLCSYCHARLHKLKYPAAELSIILKEEDE